MCVVVSSAYPFQISQESHHLHKKKIVSPPNLTRILNIIFFLLLKGTESNLIIRDVVFANSLACYNLSVRPKSIPCFCSPLQTCAGAEWRKLSHPTCRPRARANQWPLAFLLQLSYRKQAFFLWWSIQCFAFHIFVIFVNDSTAPKAWCWRAIQCPLREKLHVT